MNVFLSSCMYREISIGNSEVLLLLLMLLILYLQEHKATVKVSL
jgi:hypothetical protein